MRYKLDPKDLGCLQDVIHVVFGSFLIFDALDLVSFFSSSRSYRVVCFVTGGARAGGR